MNDFLTDGLPWARWWERRCRAVREPIPGAVDPGFFGRCELRPHSDRIDHALERGFDTPRWSTRWTG